MIDSHCHLADEAYASDLADVVARATNAGLAGAMCIVDAADPTEAARARDVCALWPDVRTATGIHPHRAGQFEGRVDEALEAVRARVASDGAVRAIGEVGLDYHYDFSPRSAQREVFAGQVELAGLLRLPLVIHTREADRDTVDILRSVGGGRATGVFHCFSGDLALARQALDLGFYLSFSGIVTFPKAGALREIAVAIPDDRLLVETDCPYLAPVPHRGRRNEPAWVTRVAETLAALRGRDAVEFGAMTDGNYRRLFAP